MKVMMLAAASDIHAVRWANQLCENGNEVHLCYVSNHKPSMDKFNKNVTLHELKYPAPLGYYLNKYQLKKIIRSVKPDIINTHYSSGYGTLGRLVKFSPYLVSVYGSDVYDFPYKSNINMKIIRKNLVCADGIASTSIAMANQVSKLINYPVDKIYITPFGVNVDKFSKKRGRNLNSKNIKIGSIKKLSPKYGIKYGILAIDYLLKHYKIYENGIKIKYLIYGDGEEKQELEHLIDKLNLRNVVEIKGRIPNEQVPEVLNDLDIFLGTSILDSESFGVAIVEAMSCEVPVIVTDVDGFKEVVDYGNAGIMVPRKDINSMAHQIYNLIIDPKQREEIGQIQRQRVIENYNWIENVQQMEQIYREMIKKKLSET